MPGNFLNMDTNVPALSGEGNVKDDLKQLKGFLYMLLESLRYTLNNLGGENFNAQALTELGETITRPVRIALEDAEGNITSLTVEAGQLESRVQDAEGNISTLEQTAEGLTTSVKNANGDISGLKQTAKDLTASVKNANGDISTLKQTAEGLTTSVKNANGDISELKQTAEDLTASVGNLESGMGHTLRLAADGMTVTDAAGQTVTISNGNLDLTGAITFTDLNAAAQKKITDAQGAANNANDALTELGYTGTKIDGKSVISPYILGGVLQGGKIYTLDDRGAYVMFTGGGLRFYTDPDGDGNFYQSGNINIDEYERLHVSALGGVVLDGPVKVTGRLDLSEADITYPS